MFWLHPKRGLHIEPRHIALAEVARKGGRPTLTTYQVIDIPEGLIRPSPTEPNILKPEEVKHAIREVFTPQRVKGRISLSLPDISVKAALLEVPALPAKKDEAEALVRWKMEKAFVSPSGQARLSYQRISPASQEGSVRVLACSMKEEILREYESLITSLGLLPDLIDISSFHIYNLYADYISHATLPGRDCAFLNLSDLNLALMIFRGGVLDFLRIKKIPRETDPACAGRIAGDITASLATYEEEGRLSQITHLFLCGNHLTHEVGKEIERAFSLTVEWLGPQIEVLYEGIVPEEAQESALLIPAVAAAIGR